MTTISIGVSCTTFDELIVASSPQDEDSGWDTFDANDGFRVRTPYSLNVTRHRYHLGTG